MYIAIHVEDGFVQRVTTDDCATHDVVVVSDGEPETMLRTRFEDAITKYCAGARSKRQTLGIGMAVDYAIADFTELSRQVFNSPNAYLAATRREMAKLSDNLRSAMALNDFWTEPRTVN